MTKREIKSKFDEIVDFAGVERYIDTPVKRYSSGMYVRLAFAVAAHLEPEILIVDEVLAVGDAEFQKKCLGKMKDVSVNQGRTVLFVSHNMDAILRLCNQSLLMKNGRAIQYGDTEKIINTYMIQEFEQKPEKKYIPHEAPGNDVVILLESAVIDSNFNVKANHKINEIIGIRIIVEIKKDIDNLVFGFNLYNQLDIHILSSHQKTEHKNYKKGLYETVVWLPANFLAEGMHYCGIAAMSYAPVFYVHFHDIKKFSFNVNDIQGDDSVRGEYTGVFPGVIRPNLNWSPVKSK